MSNQTIPTPLKVLLTANTLIELSVGVVTLISPSELAKFKLNLKPFALTPLTAEQQTNLVSGGDVTKALAYKFFPASAISLALSSHFILIDNKVSQSSLYSIAFYHFAAASLAPAIPLTSTFGPVSLMVHVPLAVGFGLYAFYYDKKSPYGLSILSKSGSIFKPTWFFGWKLQGCSCGKDCGCCKCGPNCNCSPTCTCCKCGDDCKCGTAESSCCKTTTSCKCGKSCGCCKCGPNCNCSPTCTCCKCGDDCKCDDKTSAFCKKSSCKCGKACGCCKCGPNCNCSPTCTCCKCGDDCKCGDEEELGSCCKPSAST